MGVKFNPFTGNLDLIDTTAAAGLDGQVQFNSSGLLDGSADFTWDDTGKVLDVGGDINLDDGGSFQTTLQLVTPTAARTITFPDATGTVGLVAGSTTEAAYASLDGGFAGAVPFAWDGSFSVDGSFGYNPTGGVLSVRDLRSITLTSPTIAGNTTFTGRFINSVANAASAPAGLFSGQWFTTGTSTTTKPAVNIEQSGATSTGWSTAGTGLGVNSASTFAGRLLDLQKNATSKFSVSHEGNIAATGDLNLDDGGSFQTTLQLVTPTAARTITFPDATGTVALVGGSTGQLLYNNAGANAGLSTLTTDGTDVTLAGRFISSLNGAASAPPGTFTGTWFTGGTATTTKPQVLIEPAGTTSTAWSTSGTGLGVNAASGFAGRLLDLQLNGTSNFNVDSTGRTSFPLGTAALPALYPGADTNTGMWSPAADTLAWSTNGVERTRIDSSGRLLVGTSTSRAVTAGTSVNWNPRLQVTKTGIDAANIAAYSFSTYAVDLGGGLGIGPDIVLARSNSNTEGTQTAIANNMLLGRITFNGSDGTAFQSGAFIAAASDGQTWASGDCPTRLVFSTTADNASSPTERLRITSAGVLQVADAGNISVGTTTGTKIGTATTQKLGFYDATPVVQPAAVADITTTATAGTLPTPDGSVTVADADAPTVTELLEYCVELEAKLEAALGHLRTLGLIAT
jgi:hypothetical protein